MSVLYPDLNLTNFPNSEDIFTTWVNIIATDGPLILQYQQALQSGNQVLANQILNTIPSANQKIIKATDLNKMTQAILALERFYTSDIEDFVNSQQESWENIVSQFSYKGDWNSGTTYVQNNIVTYTYSGLNLVYIGISSNIPVGANPLNTSYWRVLTIQGKQGESGPGLSYRQNWNSGTQYYTNDAVTYSGAIWMALKNNINSAPSISSSNWQQIIYLPVTTYPIQDTEPVQQNTNELWFDTSVGNNNYYQLESLANPATASDIASGKEAYNQIGQLIVGTAN